jgi:diacylglycerol kinase (ATP)
MTAVSSRVTFVLLNEAARQGRGRKRWQRVQPALGSLAPLHTTLLEPSGSWVSEICEALECGVRTFLAAGGDGTVGSLVDALSRARSAVPLSELWIAAVGLGSSNDFHKPFGRVVAGVPLRVDRSRARPRDIGWVRYSDELGRTREKYFVVSASVGVVARANALFNEASGTRRWLQRWMPGLMVPCCALDALARHVNQPVTMRFGDVSYAAALSNLSVSKTRHLAGSLSYDAVVPDDDGRLAVHLCEQMKRSELLSTFAGLLRGRFNGRPHTRSWSLPEFDIVAESPFDLEVDGEVTRARAANFAVLDQRPWVCA